MYRVKVIILALVICFVSLGAERNEPHQEELDFEAAGFQQMHTTAYVIHGTTATGTPTRPGICACNPHLGEVAIVYTLDGDYLGMYEVVDTGITNGLINGTVIDVWRCNMTQATNYMRITEGRVWVKFIKGNG